MDLNAQAQQAVQNVFIESGVNYDAEIERAAKMVWLDGHKAGADAVRKMAQEVFLRHSPVRATP